MKKTSLKGHIVLGILIILLAATSCQDPISTNSSIATDVTSEQKIPAGITNTGVVGYVKNIGRSITPPYLRIRVTPADNPLIVGKCYKFEVANPPVPGTYRFSYDPDDFGSCSNGGTNWIALTPLHCGRDLYISVRTPSINGNIFIYYFDFDARYDLKDPIIRLPPGPFELNKEYLFNQPYIDLKATYDIVHSDGFMYMYHGYCEGGYNEKLKAVKTGWHWVQAVAISKECTWQNEKSDKYWVFIC